MTSEKVDVRGKSIHVLRSGHGQQVESQIYNLETFLYTFALGEGEKINKTSKYILKDGSVKFAKVRLDLSPSKANLVVHPRLFYFCQELWDQQPLTGCIR